MVQAALRLLLDLRHLAVRVEDIVDEVGISRATFYFAERDEILAELFARLLTTDVDPPQGGSSLERIQNLLVAAAQQMTKWEDLARFVYSIPLRHDAVLPGGSGEPAVMTRARRLVQEGVAAGELRSDVPADVLSRHLADSCGAAMREWATGQVDDAPERVRLLLDVAIGGLRPSNRGEVVSPAALVAHAGRVPAPAIAGVVEHDPGGDPAVPAGDLLAAPGLSVMGPERVVNLAAHRLHRESSIATPMARYLPAAWLRSAGPRSGTQRRCPTPPGEESAHGVDGGFRGHPRSGQHADDAAPPGPHDQPGGQHDEQGEGAPAPEHRRVPGANSVR